MMSISNQKRLELINSLCRICAKENSNSVPIFSDLGRRQNIMRKIQACLPVHIQENDNFPKQICLACLTKLDSFWDMHVMCKEAQIKIEKKFYALGSHGSLEQANSSSFSEDTKCGVCKSEVLDEHFGIGCEGPCQKWFHCSCVKMLLYEYFYLVENTTTETWYCNNCIDKVPRSDTAHTDHIEAKLRSLTERYPVSYGESAVICLARAETPPPTPTPTIPAAAIARETQMLPQGAAVEPVLAPVTYLAPAPTVPTPTPTEEVYPQALIEVSQASPNAQPTVYQAPPPPPPAPPRRRVAVSSPAASTSTSTQRSTPTSLKRPHEDSSNGQKNNDKKLCVYCKKYFTDDIIDHHVSLHLRQSFSSCVECGKNFRSEEAMQRHRCGEKRDEVSETIDLRDDDEMIIG